LLFAAEYCDIRVTGTWVEPAITCKKNATDAVGFWVGIDGLAKKDDTVQRAEGKEYTIEQVAVVAECTDGEDKYFGAYEMYPLRAEKFKDLTIEAGSTVVVTVSYDADAKKYTLELSVTPRGQTGKPVTTDLPPSHARPRTRKRASR
jgi:hypothetical protein